MKEERTTSASSCFLDSHLWLWAGSGEIPEGTPCACGAVKYQKDKYCPTCGQELKEGVRE